MEPSMRKKTKGKTDALSAESRSIPQEEWESFLTGFSARHIGWLIRIETHDRVTEEHVSSGETLFQSIEYDLEDEKNPRINVVVRFDNKVVKHILYRPSKMTLASSEEAGMQSLHVSTVNTETDVHLRMPAQQKS